MSWLCKLSELMHALYYFVQFKKTKQMRFANNKAIGEWDPKMLVQSAFTPNL